MRVLQLYGGSQEEISAVRQDIATYRRAYNLATDTVEGRRPPDMPAKAQPSGPQAQPKAQPKAQPGASRLAQALGSGPPPVALGPPPPRRAQSSPAQPSPAQPKAPRVLRSPHESNAHLAVEDERDCNSSRSKRRAEMTRRAMYTRKSTAVKQAYGRITIDEMTADIEMLTSRLRKWAAQNPKWRRGG